ncbi:MAG: o-succinylbenzoate synthase [Acidimicrobiaceae bacterium]|nr:o-succinylbenzoate synthase [Acidimicrobiaceae bacterium]MYE98045.1 o-succinylbenzoate synthase [Acidimicrobiaceae bacterium]MYH44809.1 o-succinylbenzoate synthase [Acidimicrobiaceae bacterium]MYI53670.1 o-succinylbenzoate synthase [Acidimicrobiaceae bacterium]MYJ42055.1 o-succinylbenzoate synthase [Acidimicrobiaceae bacterium]
MGRRRRQPVTALRAELHPFRLALRSPLLTGGVSIRCRAGFLVALSADGITGWGEASPLPGWSRTSLLDTETALRSVSDDLARGGEAALDAVLAAMHDAPHARAGVAGAWADLQALRTGQRLAGRLVAYPSCAPASEVAVNALVAAPEPSEVEQAAHDAVEAGFQAVKLKVGAVDPEVDVSRIRAARAGLGPAAELRLDANGAWDERTALEVLERVEDSDIAYCEEPVAGIDAIAAVSQRGPVPAAVDESICDESDAVRALDAGIGNLIVKPQALGGPDVALAIAARAHEAEASVTVTSFLDSAVGVAHALHVAAAVDGASRHPRAHGLATWELLAADVAGLPPVTAGVMSLPPGYGIGVVPEL